MIEAAVKRQSKPPLCVLFVCLGNICRSPAAEGVLARAVYEAGLASEITVDSAGTGGWHVGARADPRMRRAAAARGLELTSRARQLIAEDHDRFDLIVAMDRENRLGIERLAPASGARAEVVLLSSFLDDAWPEDVPDPYYGGDDGFTDVLDMLEAACPALVDHLLSIP